MGRHLKIISGSVLAFCAFFMSNLTLEALCVNVSKANLRYGPSTNHQKTWEVYKFMPFQSLKTTEGWHRVKDVDGDIHWIATSLVTDAFDCAVVKSETVNLRSSPQIGKNNEVNWGPAKKYWAFKVLERRGKWIHLEDAIGRKAWAHSDYLWIQ